MARRLTTNQEIAGSIPAENHKRDTAFYAGLWFCFHSSNHILINTTSSLVRWPSWSKAPG
ncbi:hypothetical protein N7536_011121 [Penicillium majusculum]|nr:hypothetical protein N7536_011121 [Penicillium majusculum]